MQQETKTTPLIPKALEPLPVSSIHPEGWLRNQLQIQANGLSGHLDEFWPDVANSRWIGGSAEGWERGPYWLDGVVPLAFLLDERMLKAKVKHWIDTILASQHKDGWLGPIHDQKYGYPYDPWPVYLVLKAMTQWYDATGDARIIPAMERFLQRLATLLAEKPLASWAKMRWPDLLLSIHWLYERTGIYWLLDLAQTVKQQGFDWQAQFAAFPFKEKQSTWTLENHVVNNAMAIKQPAVWFRQSHDETDRRAAYAFIETLDRYHGQATGMFSGDEILAGKNPSQGTELCAVVEYMFSLEVLIAILGDPALADRLERIAFNALPATFKPDMWAHQYDQQANQVICKLAEERIYTTNGPESNIYGLAPNFGCCTANMHQGWPKFAAHLWMRSRDGGLAAIAYAPCTVSTAVAGTPVQVQVATNYPFDETIRVTVSTDRAVHFPVHLRIPAWAQGATLAIDGAEPEPAEPGHLHTIERAWSGSTQIVLQLPMHAKTETRYNGSATLERGPLVYALKIGENWQYLKGELPHADWEVYPTTAWNYALAIDREHPENSVSFEQRDVGEMPFSPEGAPLQARVKGRRVAAWQIDRTAAGPIPSSPVDSVEPNEEITLIPYGCTNLRVTEFPTLGTP